MIIVFHYHNNRILISSKHNMEIKLYPVKHKQTRGYFRANKPNKLESLRIVPVSVKDTYPNTYCRLCTVLSSSKITQENDISSPNIHTKRNT